MKIIDETKYKCPLCLEEINSELDILNHFSYNHDLTCDDVDSFYKRVNILGLNESDFVDGEIRKTEI